MKAFSLQIDLSVPEKQILETIYKSQFMGDWMILGKLRTHDTTNGESRGSVSMKRGIFQGDSISLLLFVVS